MNTKTKSTVCILILVLCVSFFTVKHYGLERVSAENLVSVAEENVYTSAAIILLLYYLKSLAVAIPVIALEIASGMIFPLHTAILINVAGKMLFLSQTFVFGKCADTDSLKKKLSDSKIYGKIESLAKRDEFLFSYLIHVVQFVQLNAAALFCGACGMKYKNYFSGALLGVVPSTTVVVAFADCIGRPATANFVAITACAVTITALSTVLSVKLRDI